MNTEKAINQSQNNKSKLLIWVQNFAAWSILKWIGHHDPLTLFVTRSKFLNPIMKEKKWEKCGWYYKKWAPPSHWPQFYFEG